MTDAADILSAIRRDTDVCIAESLKDPDLASASHDVRVGYERGFREGIAVALALALRLLERRSDEP
jgi:hypothetical protein